MASIKTTLNTKKKAETCAKNCFSDIPAFVDEYLYSTNIVNYEDYDACVTITVY